MRKRFFRSAVLSIAAGLLIAFLFAVPLMEQIYTDEAEDTLSNVMALADVYLENGTDYQGTAQTLGRRLEQAGSEPVSYTHLDVYKRQVVRPAVELLAGIPSVIYGFFGMIVLVPFIRKVFPTSFGDSLLAMILILAIMVLPTIISVSETALRSVPASYKEASLALGNTHIGTIFKVLVPAAKSGILAGVILGVGRAVGETMAVVMVCGNKVQFPQLLKSVRPLTSGVVLEMSYASGLHRQALFSIGLVLFVFIMIVNISFTMLSKRGVQISGKE